MFFCGNEPDCIAFNSDKALKRAMGVVDKEYLVVGVLENLNESLLVFEKYLPKFFRSAFVLHQESDVHMQRKNHNPNKRNISKELRSTLEGQFSKEFEFYSFCKQKLDKQMRAGPLPQSNPKKRTGSGLAYEKRKFVLL